MPPWRSGCSIHEQGMSSMGQCDKRSPHKPHHHNLSLLTCSHFSDGNSQSLCRASLECSPVLHLSLENSLAYWWLPWSWEDCGYTFLGWSRTCQGGQGPGLGLQGCQSASSFLFTENLWTVLPWDAEVWGGPTQGWPLAASEKFQPPFLSSQPSPPQQKSVSFLPPQVHLL